MIHARFSSQNAISVVFIPFAVYHSGRKPSLMVLLLDVNDKFLASDRWRTTTTEVCSAADSFDFEWYSAVPFLSQS